MEQVKNLLWPVIAVIVGLIVYDMFVRKALKISSYDEYENLDSVDEID